MERESEISQNRRKRIAIIGSPDLEFYGGTQVSVIESTEILFSMGFDVTVFGSGTYFERRNIDLGEKIRYVKNAFPFDPFSWRTVQKVSRGVSEPLIGMFTSKKIMKVVGDYDGYYFTAPKFIFRSISERIDSRKRVLLANHGTYLEFLSARKGILSRALINLFDSIFLKHASRENTFIHTQNAFQRKHYLERGIPEEKIFLIPQCEVDFSKFSVKNNDDFRVLFLNRLSTDKGAHLIPMISNRCKGINFVVIGGGPLLNQIRSSAGDNVRLTGFLSESDKQRVVEKCDVILNLSSYESLSISSIEGLAAGLRVISKERTSGLSFIAESVEGSVYFAGGSIQEICEMLEKLRREKEADPFNFHELKEGIRKRAEAIFDKNVINRKMEGVFSTVFGSVMKDGDGIPKMPPSISERDDC